MMEHAEHISYEAAEVAIVLISAILGAAWALIRSINGQFQKQADTAEQRTIRTHEKIDGVAKELRAELRAGYATVDSLKVCDVRIDGIERRVDGIEGRLDCPGINRRRVSVGAE